MKGRRAAATLGTALLLCAVAVLFPVGGCALGFAGATAWGDTTRIAWIALPSPPSPPRHIDGATTRALRVEAQDGKRYAYEVDAPGSGWTAPPAATPSGPEEREGCPATSFYRVPPPPGPAAQRICTEWNQHNEAAGRREYALLDDGRLYTWYHHDAGITTILVLIAALVAGGVVGVVAAVIAGILIWRRSRDTG
jgi:hypothetical protein